MVFMNRFLYDELSRNILIIILFDFLNKDIILSVFINDLIRVIFVNE